jgi:taurine dioxygenase
MWRRRHQPACCWGIEIPKSGGDTYFADQAAAHSALPPSLLQRAAGLSIKHDAAHTSVGSLRPGYEPFDDPRDAPGSTHPVIRLHEETERRVLYLGPPRVGLYSRFVPDRERGSAR